VVLPDQGEMVGRLQMVASMLARSGYDITIKSASELTSAELEENSLFILGEYENNSIYQKLALPEKFKLTAGSIMIDDQLINGEKGSAIISFAAPGNSDKNVSLYLWNSATAISSFRKMFHYMNDSWQLFDLAQKENGALASGQIFPTGKNDLKHEF
jgi:hypothetical protein